MEAGVPLSQCVHEGNVHLVWQKCPGELLYDDELWIAAPKTRTSPFMDVMVNTWLHISASHKTLHSTNARV